MPYRDAEATLDEAMDGVLAERDVDLALVAVDDGSQDGGPELVRERARSDTRIVQLETGGAGLVVALETGWRSVDAPFVARMDADDVSVPGRIARASALLAERPELGAVGTRAEAFPPELVGEGLAHYVAWQNAIVSPEDHAREIWVESPLCHPSVVMRRTALESVGGYREERWAEDYDLWLRMHVSGFGLAKVPEVLLRWRHHARRATFAHARYELARFAECKARYLAPLLLARAAPVVVWGAGQTGRRFARALEAEGVRTSAFVDIDPRKIGRTARGAPIEPPSWLRARTDATILVAVGARGARALVRAQLDALSLPHVAVA